MIESEIFASFVAGRDPDAVPESVVEEEMSLFGAFTRQNQALGG